MIYMVYPNAWKTRDTVVYDTITPTCLTHVIHDDSYVLHTIIHYKWRYNPNLTPKPRFYPQNDVIP